MHRRLAQPRRSAMRSRIDTGAGLRKAATASRRCEKLCYGGARRNLRSLTVADSSFQARLAALRESSRGNAEGHARRFRRRSRALREILACRRRPAARLVEMRGRRDKTMELLAEAGRGRRRREAPRRDVLRARRSTSPKTAPCCTRRCATARAPRCMVDGQDVMPDVHAVLDAMGDILRRRPLGRGDGRDRQEDHRRRQYRHRRLRPRPGHGDAGAGALS